jgi:hypothetical protein
MSNRIIKKIDPERMLKGRIAETLVEQLLRKSGNEVYRFGYEAIMQNLVQIKETFAKHGSTAEQISTIPDFIVINSKREPFFVEVKFRRNGELFDTDMKRFKLINQFWKAKIILVNGVKKPFFEVVSAPYFDAQERIISKPLLEEATWEVKPETYAEFEDLVEKYLIPAFQS